MKKMILLFLSLSLTVHSNASAASNTPSTLYNSFQMVKYANSTYEFKACNTQTGGETSCVSLGPKKHYSEEERKKLDQFLNGSHNARLIVGGVVIAATVVGVGVACSVTNVAAAVCFFGFFPVVSGWVVGAAVAPIVGTVGAVAAGAAYTAILGVSVLAVETAAVEYYAVNNAENAAQAHLLSGQQVLSQAEKRGWVRKQFEYIYKNVPKDASPALLLTLRLQSIDKALHRIANDSDDSSNELLIPTPIM